MNTQLQLQANINRSRMARAAVLMLLLASSPAFAQITKVNTVLANVQSILIGVAVTVFTIALMWVGFKLAFQHAKWSEVSNIVIGAIIVGGAAGIASWLLN